MLQTIVIQTTKFTEGKFFGAYFTPSSVLGHVEELLLSLIFFGRGVAMLSVEN